MTREEYMQRRFEFCRRGEHLPQSKLTAEDVRHIRALHEFKKAEIKRINDTLGIEALAEKFDVAPSTVEKILSFQTWKHV